jgi:hypothetical protein
LRNFCSCFGRILAHHGIDPPSSGWWKRRGSHPTLVTVTASTPSIGHSHHRALGQSVPCVSSDSEPLLACLGVSEYLYLLHQRTRWRQSW